MGKNPKRQFTWTIYYMKGETNNIYVPRLYVILLIIR